MINFFLKIRWHLLVENKTIKYLRYSIGEILLGVFGTLNFKNKDHLALGFFYIFCSAMYGQNQVIADSLESIYNSGRYLEKDQLQLLYDLAKYHADIEKSLHYSNELLLKAKALDSSKRIIGAYMEKGSAYRIKGDLSKALESFFEAVKIAKEKERNRDLGLLYSDIAIVYSIMGDDQNTILNYKNAISILKEENDSLNYATVLENLGDHYSHSLGKPDSALLFFKQSGDIYKALDHKLGIAYNLGNVGLAYAQIGEYDIAEENLKQSKIMLEELGDYYPSDVYREFMSDIYAEQIDKKQIEVDLLNQQKKTQRIIVIATTFALVLIFIFSFGLYRRNKFIRITNRIIEKERNRSEELLLNILPAEIAEELKEKGSADARNFNHVSILFTDFKEFTKISQNLSANELISEINHCFKAFDNICEKYNIEKIKTIGDSFMAAGGMPIQSNESAKNTTLAALEMQSFISERIAQKQAKNEIVFEMRLGIHTGPVVAGIVGVKKFQYDVWGDTVNTASRMQSNGEVGKVNISQHTFELIKDDPNFTFEKRGKIQVKGKGELEMYFVSLKNVV